MKNLIYVGEDSSIVRSDLVGVSFKEKESEDQDIVTVAFHVRDSEKSLVEFDIVNNQEDDEWKVYVVWRKSGAKINEVLYCEYVWPGDRHLLETLLRSTLIEVSQTSRTIHIHIKEESDI